jgi:hypothetical protein
MGTTQNRIELQPGGVKDEGEMDAAVYPGMNIVRASDGNYDPGAGAAEAMMVHLVLEDALQGKTTADAYADGDKVPFVIPKRGCIYNVRVSAGETVVIGSLLVANTDGDFIVEDAEGRAQFIAQEASGGALAADTLIKARAV